MENNVYIIIVTYNAMKWIDRCLHSIVNSTRESKVVIIDNGSKDDTICYVKEHFPNVHIIQNKYNRGFGQANNQGIEYAYFQGATHFFLLNQDASVEAKTIEKLVNIQNKFGLSVVSPIHFNGRGDNYDYGFYSMAMVDALDNHFLADVTSGHLKDYYIVNKINAAAWMVSRKTVEEIGGFNPLFFHYGEDVNYLQRLKFHQKQLAFVPSSFIFHDRERVGNKKMFEKRVIISNLLNTYANVNIPFMKLGEKTKLNLKNIKQAMACLVNGNFKQFFRFFSSYFELIMSIPKIIDSRKRDRLIGHTWLNLDLDNYSSKS